MVFTGGLRSLLPLAVRSLIRFNKLNISNTSGMAEGIGDGGNELGMGKVKEAVRKHIKNGDVIACDVEADFAIVAGVSNWGGYAVACALYILNTCEIHNRYLRKAIGFPRLSKKANWASALPSITKEETLLKTLIQHGVRSGITASLEMEVDGLPFYNIHSVMIEKLLAKIP